MEQIKPVILEHREHIHQSKLIELKCRDFHKIAYNIFNLIPEDEQAKHLQDFNHMITSWHYQPHETWLGPSGVWQKLQSYLIINFPDPDKYQAIADIFNHP